MPHSLREAASARAAESPPSPAPARRRTPSRRVSLAIAVLASLLAAGMVVQVCFVGLALFVNSLYWWPHHALGHGLVPAALVLLVLALVGRQPKRVRWRAAALLVLLLVQGATAAVKGLAGAVHPVNAILIFWVTFTLVSQARAAHDAGA